MGIVEDDIVEWSLHKAGVSVLFAIESRMYLLCDVIVGKLHECRAGGQKSFEQYLESFFGRWPIILDHADLNIAKPYEP